MLTLYVTDHCSLCDEAFNLLSSMPELAGMALTTVDIAADEALFAQYGEHIPVLVGPFGELRWPFASEQVRQALGF